MTRAWDATKRWAASRWALLDRFQRVMIGMMLVGVVVFVAFGQFVLAFAWAVWTYVFIDWWCAKEERRIARGRLRELSEGGAATVGGWVLDAAREAGEGNMTFVGIRQDKTGFTVRTYGPGVKS